jgi:CobQ-like glutamine amidotransferase family enzyme
MTDATRTDALHIVQLYPAELGITGDRGNVRALEARLERSGIAVEVTAAGVGDALPDTVDLYVLGNGPLSAMRGVLDDLRSRRDRLTADVQAGVPLLAVGGSAELLSSGITLLDGERIAGLGVFPFSVTRTRERRVGYIVVDAPFGRVVGFEDHASFWTLESGADSVGAVVDGKGSFATAKGAGEIVRVNTAYATNVQGPVLPLNPALADVLLSAATSRRGVEWSASTELDRLNDYAAQARATIERTLHGRNFNAMGV